MYWPAFLMAADLPLPRQIWAHGWLLFDSEKMSKSRGNVVRPRPIVNVLGIEPLRYYLLREIVFGQDGSFSYDALVEPLQQRPGERTRKSRQPHAHHDRPLLRRRDPEAGGGAGAEGYAPGSADFASEALTKITAIVRPV